MEGMEWHVLAYSSWILLPVETRYLFVELEALAVVWAIHHSCHYFFGRPFTVVMDHHSLCNLCLDVRPLQKDHQVGHQTP